ncbi:MAG: DUF1207 domain-containing protein [Planctomycetaceae bacterium]
MITFPKWMQTAIVGVVLVCWSAAVTNADEPEHVASVYRPLTYSSDETAQALFPELATELNPAASSEPGDLDEITASPVALSGSPIGYQPQNLHPDHEALPAGLLYRSYAAGPNESRFSTVYLYDFSSKKWDWDSTLGGRVGLYRRNRPVRLPVDVWQIDMEGSTKTRLNPHQQEDLESADYRFGLLWTGRRDNLSLKFGYFHVSSHVGDEYMVRHPTFERINFVRESLIWGASAQLNDNVRTYGEFAYAFHTSGGADKWQFQFGSEFAATPKFGRTGAPFLAANMQLREETDYQAGTNIIAAWQWKGRETGHAFRLGAEYFNGPTNQFEFFRRYQNQLGLGAWFDY